MVFNSGPAGVAAGGAVGAGAAGAASADEQETAQLAAAVAMSLHEQETAELAAAVAMSLDEQEAAQLAATIAMSREPTASTAQVAISVDLTSVVDDDEKQRTAGGKQKRNEAGCSTDAPPGQRRRSVCEHGRQRRKCKDCVGWTESPTETRNAGIPSACARRAERRHVRQLRPVRRAAVNLDSEGSRL